MKKRILSILLICCMVFSLFPVSTLAANSDVPFTDVKTTDWFYDEVCYAYEHGLMQGTAATTFDPNGTTSRGMIVTILYRLEGEPSFMNDNIFTDVVPGSWYEKAVVWANGKSIVKGYGNEKFGSDDPITREQLAAIMYRYANYKGYDTAAKADLSDFVDSGKISSYALDAMKWANAAGLINGIGASKLDPQGDATRAQVAAIFYRFCDAFVTEDTYTVTFDLNYGSAGTYTTQTVKSGEKAAQPTAPKRSGYTFAGWYTKDVGGSKFDFGTAITADLTLYAHWTKNGGHTPYNPPTPPAPTTYTVTFDLNDIEGTAPTVQTIDEGGKVTEPTGNLPTLEDHTLQWFTKDAADKLSVWDFENNTVTADMTLYAYWTRTLGSILSTDESFPTSENDVAPDNAWVNGTNKVFIGVNMSKNLFALKAEGKTVYWDLDSVFTKIDNKYEGDIVVPGGRLVLTCNMTGNKITSIVCDGTGTDFDVLNGTYTPAAQATTYTVTFDMQGHGTAIEAYTNVTSGSAITEPIEPTATDYIFEGWYKEAACENVWDFDNDTVTANTTLYAKWVEGKTFAEILGTVTGGFPTTAEGAWTASSSLMCYITDSGQCLDFFSSSVSKVGYNTQDNMAKKSEDSYIYNSLWETITFNMTGGVLTSITYTGIAEDNKILDGTYAPAVPTFKAVYNTKDNVNTLTFYYDTVDHSGDNITVYDNLPTAATQNSDWGYNKICTNVKSVVIDSSVANYKVLTSTTYMFYNMQNAGSISGAEYLDVSNVTNMSYMFRQYGYNSTGLTDVPDVSGWNTGNVTNMSNMFYFYGYKSTELTTVPDVSQWNTEHVTDMSSMFDYYGYSSTGLTAVPNVSGWNTEHVTNMSYMFRQYGYNSTVLTAVPDVSQWNTGNVTDMSRMFYGYGYNSTVLTAVPDVSQWNTGNVTDMSYVFYSYGYKSTVLNTVPDVSGWNTGNVTNMLNMFYNYGYTSTGLSFTLDLSKWSVAKVTSYNKMFDSAGAAITDPAKWSVTIPGFTGTTANTVGAWYVGTGTDTSKYIAPASDRSFTPVVAVNDLPSTNSNFPTALNAAWQNGNGMGCILYSNAICMVNLSTGQYFPFADTDVAVKSGNDYIFTQEGMTVVFKMTEGKLTSFTITGIETLSIDTRYNGNYGPEAISTVADVLATVEDFPTSSTVYDVPTNAWKNANGVNCYKTRYESIDCLYIAELLISVTPTVIRFGDDYVYVNSSYNYKFTFNMTGGKLTSITAEGCGESYDGTYAPATPAVVPVASVSIGQSSLELPVGEEQTLSATVAPENATNKNVTWSSSNNDVATVDTNGKVTAIAAGTATITATTVDGSKTATCAVTVTAPAPTISTIEDVLATVAGGFPEGTGNKQPPSDAWVCGDGHFTFVYNEVLLFYSRVDDNTTGMLLTATVTAGENCYTVTSGKNTLTFNMENGILNSITFSSTDEISEGRYGGTYVPAAPAPATCTVTFDTENETGGMVQDSSGQKVTEITVPYETTFSVDGNKITIGENVYTAVAKEDFIFGSFDPTPDTIIEDTKISVHFIQNMPG